jgi:hypothetical protein
LVIGTRTAHADGNFSGYICRVGEASSGYLWMSLTSAPACAGGFVGQVVVSHPQCPAATIANETRMQNMLHNFVIAVSQELRLNVSFVSAGGGLNCVSAYDLQK